MSRRERREEQAAIRAAAQALRDEIHPPNRAMAPDVAELVRQEFDRRQAAEAAERQRAADARFAGGPCVHCGAVDARCVDVSGPGAGMERPDWHNHVRGGECGTCRDWRDGIFPGTSDSELLDKVAAVLRDEGLAALNNPNRRTFKIEAGLADGLGVVAWADSGAPPGGRWRHLANVAERLERERAAAAAAPAPAITFNDLARLPGMEHDPLMDLPDELRRPREGRPISDADIATLRERARKTGAVSGRRWAGRR